MLVFEERLKPEYPQKNLSEQSREPTNSVHIWRRVRESNPGHIGGSWRALSPLRQPCSVHRRKQKNTCGQTYQKLLLPTYRLPTTIRNMAVDSWFSVVNIHWIFQFLSLELITDWCVKLSETKGQDSEHRSANVQILFTHNLHLSGSLLPLCQYLLLLLQLWFYSTIPQG